MLEKLKQYGLYVIAPILVVLGYIYYLLGKLSSLQSQVGQAKAEKQIVNILEKKEEAELNANTAEADYDSIKLRFLNAERSGRDDGSDPGPKAS